MFQRDGFFQGFAVGVEQALPVAEGSVAIVVVL
jgi:hypothetical protein